MKDREKQIEEMQNEICINCVHVMDCEDSLRKICVCGSVAEILYNVGYRKQSGWFSAKDDPPEVEQEALVYRGAHLGDLMQVMTYKGDNVWEDDYGYLCYGDEEGIACWMPLPEPPEKKGETYGG